MKELAEVFGEALDREDKARCVEMVLEWLERGQVDVRTLYLEVLAPALSAWECPDGDEAICVWKEHVRTSIVRTILEVVYPFVVKEASRRGRPENRGHLAAVLCPPGELHEIGARMVADAFLMAGYDVTFVGASTPVDDFVAAVEHLRPRYIAISVTSPYNLIALRNLVERIRERLPEGTKVVLGGRAVQQDPDLVRGLGADLSIEGFDDVLALREGG